MKAPEIALLKKQPCKKKITRVFLEICGSEGWEGDLRRF